jgi:topoisomerase-4 subunit A
MASIEDAARRGKIRIKSLNDFTAGQVEIEIQLPPEQDLDRAVEALCAFTQCQTQISSRIVVIRANRPVEMTVSEIVRHNTARLLEILRRELQLRRRKIGEEMHHLMLIRLFVENRIYRQIEATDSLATMIQTVLDRLHPFRDQLQRDITRQDAEMLLNMPIRRISRLDMGKNRSETERLEAEMAEVEKDLAALVPCAVRYLRALLKTHGGEYPRRTRLAQFREISQRDLTAHELAIGYNRDKGYLGHKVAGEPLLSCSPLDRLLLIWRDGRCKLVAPPEKLFVDTSLIYCAILDGERIMTATYECDFFTYIKKFSTGAMVTNREFRMAPKGAQIRFLTDENPSVLYVRYAADGRAKIRQQEFKLHRLTVRKRNASGSVLTANRVEFVGATKPADWNDSHTGPPGRISE